MRHNNIERIGIYKLGLVIENHLGWIFREQPIVDVGIDVLVEQSKEGNPTGKFLAIQLKSGNDVTKKSEKYFTYYISNVHYNYWLNVEIPLIIVIYRPEDDKLYWNVLCKENIIQTTKHWKIDIPKNKVLDSKAILLLEELLEQKSNYKSILSLTEDSIYDYIENMHYIIESKNSLNTISLHIETFKDSQNEIIYKLKDLVNKGLNNQSPQFKALINKETSLLNILAIRLIQEIKIYSESFATGLINFQKVAITILMLNGHRTEELTYGYNSLKELLISFDYALNGVESMRDGLLKLVIKEKNFVISQQRCKNAIEAIIQELNDAKVLTVKIIDSIDKINI